jgi:hypothetical protein
MDKMVLCYGYDFVITLTWLLPIPIKAKGIGRNKKEQSGSLVRFSHYPGETA